MLLLAVSGEPFSVPLLSIKAEEAAGHLTLKWQTHTSENEPEWTEFILQVSKDPKFSSPRTVYQGPHKSSMISGLPDGTYFFRVRAHSNGTATWSAWSQPQKLKVRHHSLTLAVTLSILGSIILLLVIITLWGGARIKEKP